MNESLLRRHRRCCPVSALALVNSILLAGFASAQTTNAPVKLPTVVVTGESEADAKVQPAFLPAVEGTRIYSGKKTSVLDLDALPTIVNNNYRQALALTPGLLLSEESTPLVSIGYRGLSPHRTMFMQVLKDGIPIHADMFGYPEAYYTPPLDTVDRMEFIHGGASLMYGPQPGGALNYVTHLPSRAAKFSGGTSQIFGSDGLYSTFNYASGTEGRVGYYAYYNHRQADGFRAANSDVNLHTGSVKLVLDADTDSRLIFAFDGYQEEHGEPGGLSLTAGPNYNVDRTATTRFNDRFRLERYFPSLTWEKDFSEGTKLELKAWGGYYSRFSKRQTGGGFGTVAAGAGNAIEFQEFYTAAAEARLRHDWQMGEHTHTFAGGVMLYHLDSPRVDKTGTTPTAEDGVIARSADRDMLYAPIFVENKFTFDKLSITPGLRIENIVQGVREKVNTSKTAPTPPTPAVPLGAKDEHSFVPLVGLGLEYELKPKVSAYANVSQSYRPMIFTAAVPEGGGTVVNNDLAEGKSWQYELGLRGHPQPWLTWDTSLFYLDFENQVGSVGSAVAGTLTFQNVGRSIHQGWEGAVELDLVGLYDQVNKSDAADRWGSVSLYANAMLLDAAFKGGANNGKAPQYAPEYLLRTGVNYRWRDRAKVSFLGTFVDDHFADDANTAAFQVPAYMTWDLTAEFKVYKDSVSILAGVNNLFGEDYYSRIRGDGIDPAYGRNYYVGVSVKF
ncbi:MAG: TonB-dependent receptor [Verrucomicrobia bacterium]|nr:TonB-dependent receptor [Verrucomicrobiota bacterium]